MDTNFDSLSNRKVSPSDFTTIPLPLRQGALARVALREESELSRMIGHSILVEDLPEATARQKSRGPKHRIVTPRVSAGWRHLVRCTRRRRGLSAYAKACQVPHIRDDSEGGEIFEFEIRGRLRTLLPILSFY